MQDPRDTDRTVPVEHNIQHTLARIPPRWQPTTKCFRDGYAHKLLVRGARKQQKPNIRLRQEVPHHEGRSDVHDAQEAQREFQTFEKQCLRLQDPRRSMSQVLMM